METIQLAELNIPAPLLQLCDQYAVVTLMQVMELITRLLGNPDLIPEGISEELLLSTKAMISPYLSTEALESLEQNVPEYPLNGLILEPVDETDLTGQQSLFDEES